MQKVIISCDIKEQEHSGEAKQHTLTVIFLTDQEEGRSCKPYISRNTIDMCESCFNKMIQERRLVTVIGAMGYNDYYLNK